MEKERLFKMTETEQCVLVAALRGNPGPSSDLASRAANAPRRRLYLDGAEYQQAIRGLNQLRTDYLAAGHYSDGIDAVMLKLMRSKPRRAPAR